MKNNSNIQLVKVADLCPGMIVALIEADGTRKPYAEITSVRDGYHCIEISYRNIATGTVGEWSEPNDSATYEIIN